MTVKEAISQNRYFVTQHALAACGDEKSGYISTNDHISAILSDKASYSKEFLDRYNNQPVQIIYTRDRQNREIGGVWTLDRGKWVLKTIYEHVGDHIVRDHTPREWVFDF